MEDLRERILSSLIRDRSVPRSPAIHHNCINPYPSRKVSTVSLRSPASVVPRLCSTLPLQYSSPPILRDRHSHTLNIRQGVLLLTCLDQVKSARKMTV